MSAAVTLGERGIRVDLVEKKSRLGGAAARWACMATDTCQHCGACLSRDIAEKLARQPDVHLWTGCEIAAIDHQADKFRTELKGDVETAVESDQVILATGFSAAQPQGLMGDVWTRNTNLVTTVELNDLLQTNRIGPGYFGTARPTIGFIQCVGSRNREMGRDYCSQVCCRVSLRHINKLRYLYPESDISLYYMDLQVIGKEMRTAFDAMSGHVRLIQGVPLEIFDDRHPGKLSVISQDAAGAGRDIRHFDLLVLSVGMHENPGMGHLAASLNLQPDAWGFFNRAKAEMPHAIHVVGAATGPMDIISAQQQGTACAYHILASYQSQAAGHEPVAVIGDGDEALVLADRLRSSGITPVLFGLDTQKTQPVLPFRHIQGTRLHRLAGTAGRFFLHYRDDRKERTDTFTAVAAAVPPDEHTAGSQLGLPKDRTFSLDDFSNILENTMEKVPDTIVFWLDFSGHEQKAAARRVLLNAIGLAGSGKQVVVIMKKVLVHGRHGQQIYDRARKYGVRFLRVASPDNVAVSFKNNKLVFRLKELTLGNMAVSFEGDWLILPNSISPGRHSQSVAGLLGDATDAEGYLQSMNVHYRPVAGLRSGVFYLGSCHGDADETDVRLEADLIAGSMLNLSPDSHHTKDADIKINPLKCRKCLTCYRICPHQAIDLKDGGPFVHSHACVSCGLCLSSCPALAIESETFDDRRFLEPPAPEKITVFACERSGVPASASLTHGDLVRIHTVPCACRISDNILLKAVAGGASKIVLAGCHPGNCRSAKGSRTAEARVNRLTALPGLSPADIAWFPVAANEPARFDQFITTQCLGHLKN